jgi:hypothetical protein
MTAITSNGLTFLRWAILPAGAHGRIHCEVCQIILGRLERFAICVPTGWADEPINHVLLCGHCALRCENEIPAEGGAA